MNSMFSSTSTPVLELRGVSKTYEIKRGLFGKRRQLAAVEDVNLTLRRGEVLGLVGESGCGKSTLAKMLLGLEKPTCGEVLVDGAVVSDRRTRADARRIQPIFQDPFSSLNPRKTIAEIISLPMEVHGIGDRSSQLQAVRDILDVVGLPRRVMGSYPGQMSGGQRQRAAIARALILKPEVVICDEPTSALDVSVQSQILNLLGDLRQEFGLTYLFISHNLAVVEHLATRVAVMYLGRVVDLAETEALFHNARHPYSTLLLSSVLTPDPLLGVPDIGLGTDYPNPMYKPSGCSFHPRCARAQEICSINAPLPIRDSTGLVECHFPQSAADVVLQTP